MLRSFITYALALGTILYTSSSHADDTHGLCAISNILTCSRAVYEKNNLKQVEQKTTEFQLAEKAATLSSLQLVYFCENDSGILSKKVPISNLSTKEISSSLKKLQTSLQSEKCANLNPIVYLGLKLEANDKEDNRLLLANMDVVTGSTLSVLLRDTSFNDFNSIAHVIFTSEQKEIENILEKRTFKQKNISRVIHRQEKGILVTNDTSEILRRFDNETCTLNQSVTIDVLPQVTDRYQVYNRTKEANHNIKEYLAELATGSIVRDNNQFYVLALKSCSN